jgi:hypothetical protein
VLAALLLLLPAIAAMFLAVWHIVATRHAASGG